ncbi:unnamed protein product [Alopecurus aequalis]
MAGLSELPDDLLRRVFHFAPVKEAASSGAISRRFRSLWRSTDAVNLEACALEDDDYYRRRYTHGYEARFLSHRDAFLSAAKAALDGPDDRVKKLSFRLEARIDDMINDFLYRRDENWSPNRIDVVADVLSHPKARLVEELQIAIDYKTRVSFDHEVHRAGFYVLALESLPSAETLRVLDLTGCQIFDENPAGGVALPRLTSLRMDNCSVPLEHLQSLVFAAPALHEVRLESVSLRSYEEKEEGTVPPPPDLSRVGLHFISGDDHKDPCALFWQFFHNFRGTKELKLLVQDLEGIAVVHAAERAKLLRPFRNLGRLELTGVHRLEGKTVAVAIANLLRCCPVLRDLQINLTTTKANSDKQPQHVHDFLQRKSPDDLHDSINHFMRRRFLSNSPEGEGEGDDDEVADIAALTGRSFRCLQHSLRRVSLRFRREKSNCFGLKLIKFFAQNARALEEMRIDGGNNRMNDHIDRKVEGWIANSSHKRNTALTVLPLKR